MRQQASSTQAVCASREALASKSNGGAGAALVHITTAAAGREHAARSQQTDAALRKGWPAEQLPRADMSPPHPKLPLPKPPQPPTSVGTRLRRLAGSPSPSTSGTCRQAVPNPVVVGWCAMGVQTVQRMVRPSGQASGQLGGQLQRGKVRDVRWLGGRAKWAGVGQQRVQQMQGAWAALTIDPPCKKGHSKDLNR